jgi:hypothetical protein
VGQGQAVRLARLRRAGSRPDPERPPAVGPHRRRLGAEHARRPAGDRLHGRRAGQAGRGGLGWTACAPRPAGAGRRPHRPPGPADIRLEALEALDATRLRVRFSLAAPTARLWDLDTPELYRLRFRWTERKDAVDTREVRFGFRWFGVEGLGTDALLRLNGRRVRLYSAISWGYWGFNGLWPTPELARREVTSAKTLGLNALHFHRNVGKPEVFTAMDEMGLLRVMEPGGGRHAIGKDLKPGESLSPADAFSRDFMVEKCKAMARAFRSHPSLVQYTLQNEIGANLANPDVQAVLKAIHDIDPSRTVILNDGFVARGAAQAMYLPYDDHYYRSDVEEWGGWWVNHQGAGDQWYDRFYQGKDDYIHRQTGKPFIVEFGEMQGCAVADNHPAMLVEILAKGGKSYDLEDHKAVVAPTNSYLERWGFQKAFPTSESLFLSVGRKAYEAWREYLENIRIGETVDVAAISGWESTAIENHSGIVDVLRGFKADPALMSQSLRPVLAIAKPRALAYAAGESAELDLYLLNDTGKAASGELVLSLVGPDGSVEALGRWPVPAQSPDRFSYLVAERVRTPAAAARGAERDPRRAGRHRLRPRDLGDRAGAEARQAGAHRRLGHRPQPARPAGGRAGRRPRGFQAGRPLRRDHRLGPEERRDRPPPGRRADRPGGPAQEGRQARRGPGRPAARGPGGGQGRAFRCWPWCRKTAWPRAWPSSSRAWACSTTPARSAACARPGWATGTMSAPIPPSPACRSTWA